MVKNLNLLCLLIIFILFPACSKAKEKNSSETSTSEEKITNSVIDKNENTKLAEENKAIENNNIDISLENIVNSNIKTTEKDSNDIELDQVSDKDLEKDLQNSSYKNHEFLPYNINSNLYPEDYKIGNLYNPNESTIENRSIAEIIINFLNTLKNKKIKQENLLSKAVIKLKALFQNILDGKINFLSYRIGTMTTEEETSRVNIRLWSPLSTTEGEVYLIKTNNRWYIEDFQIDINILSIQKKEENNKYIPNTYDIE